MTTAGTPKTIMQRTLFFLATLVTLLGLEHTAPAAESAPPEHTGLAIGQKAPAFALKNQEGAEISLPSLLKKGPVILVFYRSADW